VNRPAVRVLTAPGTGAIATVEVRGPGAWAAVQERFTPANGKPLPDRPELNRVLFGSLGDGSHADEVVVAVKADDVIEVHGHGGRRVVEWISELLGDRLNTKPTRRDGWAFLPHTLTLRAASILLDQCHGAFDRAVRDMLSSLESAGEKLAALAHHAGVGRHLTSPWKVVIAGEPNVGKSSLMNAFAGYQRSIISPTPGTTRDVVSTLTAVDGWPVELLDTAGLRDAADSIEAEGVGRAGSARSTADLVLWVLDAHGPNQTPPSSGLVVVNKTDLAPGWDWDSLPSAVRVSAATGAGIPELLSAVAARLVPHPPASGTAVPYAPFLADAVAAAHAAFLSGNFGETRTRLAECLPPDPHPSDPATGHRLQSNEHPPGPP
jgi:tRNA modification GTPase